MYPARSGGRRNQIIHFQIIRSSIVSRYVAFVLQFGSRTGASWACYQFPAGDDHPVTPKLLQCYPPVTMHP